MRIAVLEEASTWNTQETIDANARLIAATPDLLAAVKNDIGALHNLLALLWDNRPDLADLPEFTEAARACKSARAALAKMKGG